METRGSAERKAARRREPQSERQGPGQCLREAGRRQGVTVCKQQGAGQWMGTKSPDSGEPQAENRAPMGVPELWRLEGKTGG